MKAIDFFCGAGGMTNGLIQAGIDVIAGIDIEQDFKKTYEANNKGAKYIAKDITKYEPSELANTLGISKNTDEMIFIGCSPCQYWSLINTEKYHSSHTMNLLGDFKRFVQYFLPGYIVIENVPGILKNSTNTVLLDFLDFLGLPGYSYTYSIIKAQEFGVPQTRKRFLLIAQRKNKIKIFPEKSDLTLMTVRNFIGDYKAFPIIAAGTQDKSDYIHSTSRLTSKNLSRIRETDHDGGTRENWASTNNIPVYERLGLNHFKNVYGRLYWDKPASTITTRFNSISNGRFGHPEQDRGLSLREGATLQTFPQDYHFIGTQGSIAKQIGNAVPPELAKRIGTSILNHYAKIY